MSKDPNQTSPTPQSIAGYVKKNSSRVKQMQKMKMGAGGAETIREADYKGHHIVIRTAYQIQVDGMMLTGAMGVANNGQVHYHAIPNMAFSSAVDLVKQIIDSFPDDFGKRRKRGNGSMGGMGAMPRMSRGK